MSIISSVQSLEPGTLVHLYEVQVDSSSYVYFSPYNNSDGSAIQMYDYTTNTQQNTYNTLPVKAEGFEINSDGPIARPTITFSLAGDVQTGSSTTNFRLATSSDFESLLGLKIIRRSTLANYLVGGADDPGSGNTPVEFNRQVWVIDKVKEFSKLAITYELGSPFDLDGMFLPKRQIVGNACPWVYQGAASDLSEVDKVGGCSWPRTGQISNGFLVTRVVHVNSDDEYIVSETSPSSITTYSSIASGDTITENDFVSTTTTTSRINADDTTTSGISVNEYWICKTTGTKSALNTPSDTNTNFQRVRVYNGYNASTTYYAYTDTQHNPYIRYNNRVWKIKKTATGVTPGFNDHWERGDLCGKRLKSCNLRFNATFTANTALARPSHTHNNENVLPFGGFPGSKRYS